MKTGTTLTQERLKELLYLEDGIFYWNVNYSAVSKHDKAGYYSDNGYHYIYLSGRSYSTHRLMWLYHYGYMPKMIDHIDGNPKNNSIENLRECNHQENSFNRKASKNNKTGYKNVYLRNNKYMVQLRIDGKLHHFGSYVSLDDAVKVATDQRNKLHKEFANNE